MSDADDDADGVEPPPPRETHCPVRPRRSGAGAARRPIAAARIPACLADRRTRRHRQGDARLSHGALRAGPSRSGARRRCRRRNRSHVDADHPVARRIAAQAQGDLLVLERTVNEKTGKLRTRTSGSTTCAARSRFFGSTAGEGGWRIAIVDAVDELNRRAPTRCSRCWRSRRRARCCCWSAIRAGARAADHPLALPAADVAAARRRRRGARRCRRARTAAADDRRDRGRAPRPPTAASRARWRLLDGDALDAAQPRHGAARPAAGARSARAARARRCASPAPIRRRWPPSSTP